MRTKTILIITLLIICSCTSYLLIHNKETYPIPNSDIFRYIDEGNTYLTGKIPDEIFIPPGNPILISLFSKIISVPYEEIAIATWINILSTIGLTIGVVVLMLKSFPHFSIPIVLMLCTHPLLYYIGVDVTSEPLFALIITLCLLCVNNERRNLAVILAIVSFFVRFEGLALIAGVLFIYRKQDLRWIRWWTIISITILGIWGLVLHTHSTGTSIMDNMFIREIREGTRNLPNYKVVNSLPMIFVYDYEITKLANIGILIFILGIIGKSLFDKNKTIQASALFSLGYLSIHFLFPVHNDRYFFPLLWIIPFLCMYQLSKIKLKPYQFNKVVGVFVIYCISFYVAYTNYPIIKIGFSWKKYDRIESRMLANWINNQPHDQPFMVMLPEPWVIDYFITNNSVEFMYFSHEENQNCESINCLIELAQAKYPNIPTYIAIESFIKYSNDPNNDWTRRTGINHYFEFENDPNKNATLEFQQTYHGHYFKIYQVN